MATQVDEIMRLAREAAMAYEAPQYAEEEAALRAAIEEAVKDAGRYRWLRDEAVFRGEPVGAGDMVWCVIGPNAYDLTPIDGAELDAAVDERAAPPADAALQRGEG